MDALIAYPAGMRPQLYLRPLPSAQWGAAIAAAILYPERNAEDLRFRTFIRLLARANTKAGGQLQDFIDMGSWIAPLDWKVLNAAEKTIRNRAWKRANAGLFALEPLRHAKYGEPLRHTIGNGRWNQAAAIESALARCGWRDRNNFANQFLKPAGPVIHLAAAWVTHCTPELKLGEETASVYLEQLITDETAVARVLLEAIALEVAVDHCRLRVQRQDLVQLRI